MAESARSVGMPVVSDSQMLAVRLPCWRRPVRHLGLRGRPLHHPEHPHPISTDPSEATTDADD